MSLEGNSRDEWKAESDMSRAGKTVGEEGSEGRRTERPHRAAQHNAHALNQCWPVTTRPHENLESNTETVGHPTTLDREGTGGLTGKGKE